MKQDEADSGKRPGMTSEESAELKRLKKEYPELRRANDILKAAAVISGGRCNGCYEFIERRVVSEGLARPGVEAERDRVEVVLAVPG